MAETGLPANWEVRHSSTKNHPYYFNNTDKSSRWEPPPGTDMDKLRKYITENYSASKTTPDKIRVSHLLVKHKDSRRPSSWKETEITRTKEEALHIIQGYESRIRNGEVSLGDLAVSESDDNSARKMGDLGFFGKGQMQKEFEDVAFRLGVGEVSGVVDTASGLHLIERFQ